MLLFKLIYVFTIALFVFRPVFVICYAFITATFIHLYTISDSNIKTKSLPRKCEYIIAIRSILSQSKILPKGQSFFQHHLIFMNAV